MAVLAFPTRSQEFVTSVPAATPQAAMRTNTDTYKTVSAFAIYGRVDEYTNVVLSADGLVESFEVADDEIDRMEGVINEPSAPGSSDSEDDEENEALERHRRSEAEANMFRADGDEQIFAAGVKRMRTEPVRLSDQARYQELKKKDSNKFYTT